NSVPIQGRTNCSSSALNSPDHFGRRFINLGSKPPNRSNSIRIYTFRRPHHPSLPLAAFPILPPPQPHRLQEPCDLLQLQRGVLQDALQRPIRANDLAVRAGRCRATGRLDTHLSPSLPDRLLLLATAAKTNARQRKRQVSAVLEVRCGI